MAALYKLPHIFVVENNKWAIGMDHNRATSCTLGDKSPNIYKKVVWHRTPPAELSWAEDEHALHTLGMTCAGLGQLCSEICSHYMLELLYDNDGLIQAGSGGSNTSAGAAGAANRCAGADSTILIPLLQGPAFGMPGVLVDGMDVLKVSWRGG
jgi:hypothetical protein